MNDFPADLDLDFTRPSAEDFEDWADQEHDYYFSIMVDAILDCYCEGDVAATDGKILALSTSGTYSMGDVNNAFEYFATVAKDESIGDPELLSFKERVTDLLNLYRKE